MLYLRAIVPVLPLTLYVVLLIHAYGLFPGIIISWLGIVSGTFTVFLICKKFVNTIRGNLSPMVFFSHLRPNIGGTFYAEP